MKSKRILKHRYESLRPFLIILNIFALAVLILQVPPANFIVILIFVLLSTMLVFLISSFFQRKVNLLVTIYVFSLMIITLITGFDILNTILLACVIIVLSFLLPFKQIKQKK